MGVVRSEPGDVISPGTFKRIASEGMPMHGNPFVKGNLIIAFDVEFPSPGSLRQPALKALVDALPDKPRSGADKLGDEVGVVWRSSHPRCLRLTLSKIVRLTIRTTTRRAAVASEFSASNLKLRYDGDALLIVAVTLVSPGVTSAS